MSLLLFRIIFQTKLEYKYVNMAYIEDSESKHVKRGKFGPLDLYPQEDKQKEVDFYIVFIYKSLFK